MSHIRVYNRKERLVPVEESFLLRWSPYLEAQKRGATLLYLQLQVREGEFALKDLGELIGVKSATTVIDILGALIEEKLVRKITVAGKRSEYEILPLPSFKSDSEDADIQPIRRSTQEQVSPYQDDEVVENSESKDGMDDVFVQGGSVYELFKAQYDAVIADTQKILSGNTNQLIRFFCAKYYLKFREKYKEKTTGRERRNFKDLIDEYGWRRALETVAYAIDNWDNLSYVNGFPSIAAVYGFRSTLAPEAAVGKRSKRLQHNKAHKTNETDEVGEWLNRDK